MAQENTTRSTTEDETAGELSQSNLTCKGPLAEDAPPVAYAAVDDGDGDGAGEDANED